MTVFNLLPSKPLIWDIRRLPSIRCYTDAAESLVRRLGCLVARNAMLYGHISMSGR
jgi:hypothetical protein